MAEKKQSFRFRFPWRNRGSTVEPEPRPTAKTQNPAQTTTTVPVERPPFRPAGIAPVKASPSPAQPPSSPSRGANESHKTSGAATPLEIGSSPPSPSHVTSQPQTSSKVSPQTQPSHSTTQEGSQSSPASQPEPKEAISQTPLRETQPNAEIIKSKTISNSQNNNPGETTVQTHAASAEAVETIASPEKADPASEIPAAPEKADPASPETADPASETETNEHKEGEKVVQVLAKEEKTKDPGYREPMQETITQLHAAVTSSGKNAKDLLGLELQGKQQDEKQETFERKETLSSTSSSGKLIKTPQDGSTSRMSIQKMVSSTGEQAPRNEETREDVFQLVKLATGNQMLEKPVSVITLAGENRGASMHMSSEPANVEESIPIHRSYKINPDDSPEATTIDGEASDKEEIFEDQISREDQEMKACINSNVQSINNAIVFNSSVTERNPGVQTGFSKKPAESTQGSVQQSHQAQSSKTTPEKLTHESTVRRRCLRGLFVEPIDSDPDNPEKPRRHGCLYNCAEKRKESDTGTL